MKSLALLVCLVVLPLVSSFNLADEVTTTRIFQHPKKELPKGNWKFPENAEIASPFFGYSLEVGKVMSDYGEIVRILAGAPAEYILADSTTEAHEHGHGETIPQLRTAVKYTPSMGVVYQCAMFMQDFKNVSYTNAVINCTNEQHVQRALSGFELGARDALGISMAAKVYPVSQRNEVPRNRLVACAHLRAHNCGSLYKVEGVCYVSKTVSGRGDSQYSIEWQKRTPCRDACVKNSIDLMFLVDGSQSITEARFETVKDWIIKVASGFEIEDQVQVGVVQYSHWYRNRGPERQKYLRTEIELGQYKDRKMFDAAVRNITYHGFTTYTAHAIIKTVRDDFNSKASRFPKAQRILILLTDGNSTDKEMLQTAVDYSQREKVTSFAVGVKGYVLGELELIAGSKERVITVDDFDELYGIVATIQQGIQSLEG